MVRLWLRIDWSCDSVREGLRCVKDELSISGLTAGRARLSLTVYRGEGWRRRRWEEISPGVAKRRPC